MYSSLVSCLRLEMRNFYQTARHDNIFGPPTLKTSIQIFPGLCLRWNSMLLEHTMIFNEILAITVGMSV